MKFYASDNDKPVLDDCLSLGAKFGVSVNIKTLPTASEVNKASSMHKGLHRSGIGYEF